MERVGARSQAELGLNLFFETHYWAGYGSKRTQLSTQLRHGDNLCLLGFLEGLTKLVLAKHLIFLIDTL